MSFNYQYIQILIFKNRGRIICHLTTWNHILWYSINFPKYSNERKSLSLRANIYIQLFTRKCFNSLQKCCSFCREALFVSPTWPAKYLRYLSRLTWTTFILLVHTHTRPISLVLKFRVFCEFSHSFHVHSIR